LGLVSLLRSMVDSFAWLSRTVRFNSIPLIKC
jgi:hypothetical protein